MEELVQAAAAAYENFSEDEKKRMKKMFDSMDKNGDGSISIEEFMKYYEDYGNDPKKKRHMFNLIDRSGDGNMQFHKFLTLCYIVSSGRALCCGFEDFIKGLYFTCTSCRLNSNSKTKRTYDLCICCYQGRNFKHEHGEFLDNRTYLHRVSDGDLGTGTRSKAMEELAQAAKAAYENYSEEREENKETFKSMDQNGDDKTSVAEFLKYSEDVEDNSEEICKFFGLMDQKDDGSLQFNEFLILCHIISSGRRTCDGCNELI